MRVVIAPNSFKNCLNARDVGEAIARGVCSACPDAITNVIPLSDGGDGLVSVLAGTLGGQIVESDTLDPLGRPIKAQWLKTKHCAVIEMALASGLNRLRGPEEYAPLLASTFGTGILIKAALDSGCRHIVIGLGGSATVDAGCGMASAIGYQLLDRHGNAIPEGGGGLEQLDRIHPFRWNIFRLKKVNPVRNPTLIQPSQPKRLLRRSRPRGIKPCVREKMDNSVATCSAEVATKVESHGAFSNGVKVTCLIDVQNPLLGPSGAAKVYGPQKGATPDDVDTLESNLSRWAGVVERDLGISVSAIPGAGAAGGLGAGCVAFLNATLEPGASWVAAQSGLLEAIRNADVVFTGEGRIDRQTEFGKVPAYVAQMAKQFNKPVIAFGGSVAEGIDLSAIGITTCIQISPPGMALSDAIRSAGKNLERASEDAIMRIAR